MEVVIKVTNRYCDETQRRQEIVICLDAFLCQQFLTIQTLLALRCIEMWQSSICLSKLARRLSQYWYIFRNIQGQIVKK